MDAADLPSFDERCPMSSFPIQIGGRWTAMIIQCLDVRPCRFGELRRHLAPISAKVLSETLRSMQEDGYIVRCPDGPSADGYQITPRGRSLIPLVHAARTWAESDLDQPQAASAGPPGNR